MTAALQQPSQIGAEQQQSAATPALAPSPQRETSPLRRNWLRRPLVLASLGWQQIRRAPATMCYLAAVWLAGLSTRSIARGPSHSLSGHVGIGLSSLGHGYWWTLLSAGLWASGLGSYVAVTVLGLLILAPAERRMGITRTFITLLVSQALGQLMAAGLIKLAGLAGGPWPSALAGQTAVGALSGVLGVGFAMSYTLTALWRRRLRLLLTAVVTISTLYIGHLAQVAQAFGALAGIASGALIYGRARTRARLPASRHEVRLLVGMLVAVSAVGDMLDALVTKPDGPLSLFSFLLATPGPNQRNLMAACSNPGLAAVCRELRQQQLYAQWPGVLVQFAPALLLLLSADGLRRGRRVAWWFALVINLTVLGVSAWITYAIETDRQVQIAGLNAWPRTILLPAEALVLPIATVIVLLVTRRRFDQTADRRAIRRLTTTLTVAAGVSGGAFLVFGFLLRDHFSPRPQFSVLAEDVPLRFLAGRLFSTRFVPVDLVGRLVYVWVFALFWIAVLAALAAFFLHSGTDRDAAAADRARGILTRGGSTLSYMSTWPGNQYWFSPDGRAAIAYRAIGPVALTLGGPYGDPAALESAIKEFARFCEHRGLQPALYGVPMQARGVTDRLGWRSVQIAEDARLPLARLEFAGKKWQNVRNALNKAGREGIAAEWWSYSELPPELVRQIRQISMKWVADKGLPEMGFTLGGLDELDDPNVRCLIAIGPDRKVHAITSWMPVYENGHPVGWVLDFMRKNTEPDTPHGVMEFLIAKAALTFQKEGARFISLSAAPLARLDRGEQPCTLLRLLDIFANVMEPLYGFQSLLQFKDKFHPVYQPLYLAYPDPAALGSIATAIGRAYLPHLTSRQALCLLTHLRRRGASRLSLPKAPSAEVKLHAPAH
jgi:lysylphosphatidylglycerol synthetase-like protein (DUF2156 family)